MTASSTIERCANCDRVIGKLETANLWRGQIVCPECRKRLDGDTVAGKLPSEPAPTPSAEDIEQERIGKEIRRGLGLKTVFPGSPPRSIPGPPPPVTKCPHCGSDDIARAKVLWEAGTSRGSISAGAIGLDGEIGMVGGHTSNQSLLAERLRPPTARDGGRTVAIALVLLSAFGILIGIVGIGGLLAPDRNAGPGRGGDDGGAVLGICILFGIAGVISLIVGTKRWVDAGEARKFNAYELPVLMQRWLRLWHCRRCGRTFDATG